jgi:hypothetical protein
MTTLRCPACGSTNLWLCEGREGYDRHDRLVVRVDLICDDCSGRGITECGGGVTLWIRDTPEGVQVDWRASPALQQLEAMSARAERDFEWREDIDER